MSLFRPNNYELWLMRMFNITFQEALELVIGSDHSTRFQKATASLKLLVILAVRRT